MLTVKAGALGITFPVFQYPKPEPLPAPENPEPPRGFGKIKAKFAAWRAERKRKKAEEKARKKAAAAAAKANKPSQPRKKAKITLEILCTMLKGAGTLTKAVFGALTIYINFVITAVYTAIRGIYNPPYRNIFFNLYTRIFSRG